MMMADLHNDDDEICRSQGLMTKLDWLENLESSLVGSLSKHECNLIRYTNSIYITNTEETVLFSVVAVII